MGSSRRTRQSFERAHQMTLLHTSRAALLVAVALSTLSITPSLAQGIGALPLGGDSQANGDGSIAINTGSDIVFDHAEFSDFVPRNQAGAYGLNSIAIGLHARATADAANSIALGAGSVVEIADTLSIGDVGKERKLINLANGLVADKSTEAVNGGQLFKLQTDVDYFNNYINNEFPYMEYSFDDIYKNGTTYLKTHFADDAPGANASGIDSIALGTNAFAGHESISVGAGSSAADGLGATGEKHSSSAAF